MGELLPDLLEFLLNTAAHEKEEHGPEGALRGDNGLAQPVDDQGEALGQIIGGGLRIHEDILRTSAAKVNRNFSLRLCAAPHPRQSGMRST